ncbi:MAG: hypothetical protein GC155_08940 [Alphaproteobacteria bacterium]|nr:hypothetical protein [Alphaproteobacteria bacterium]
MTQANSLRIGLLGQFGIGNLGNEGSLEAMLRVLRKRLPEAELICICTHPDIVSKAHGVECTPLKIAGAKGILNRALLGMPGRIANLAHAIRQASKLDVLIVPGTGILDDFNESPLGLPYDLWRWTLGARLGGARVGFVSVGAGPITRSLSRFLMKGAAHRARYRSYRDLPSKAFMKGIARWADMDPVFPDLAFSLPPPRPAPRPAKAPIIVAVGVMAYYGWAGSVRDGREIYEDYIAKLARYVGWLVETGRRVKFVIGKDKDIQAVNDVTRSVLALRASHAEGLEPFEAARNLDDVMAQMAGADIAVVTRFHNLVCALKAGRPTISLGYAKKNEALLTEMGLAEFSQDVETFDLERLKFQTGQLLADRTAHEQAIRRRVGDYAEQLAHQENLLAERWLKPRASQAARRITAPEADQRMLRQSMRTRPVDE